MTLNPKSLGLAGGMVCGVCIAIVTWVSVWTGYAGNFLLLVAGIYPGYSVTVAGGVVGLIDGFIDGFVGCYLIGWLYNRFEGRVK